MRRNYVVRILFSDLLEGNIPYNYGINDESESFRYTIIIEDDRKVSKYGDISRSIS